ncbi:hypothetical protein [Tropicimonas sp. IMCC6043]|uniref:hypothetical protein n=1 Tax=Tropicimonas sp. IMCC6043 TaxID=2510645 RepID=UPI00101B6EA6|nr:hypothetical protein [Tropicimonas sp. IMCC6043]RYH10976.1 hypothetical protein EU800_06935 [Tropicimonas sp. IMCC6043]
MIRQAGPPSPVEQLAAALASGNLPRGAREMGAKVLERLAAPVRLAVLGRPDADLAGTVNALLGNPILPDRAGMPPIDLCFGTQSDIQVVTGDGRQTWVDHAEFDQLDPWQLAKVSLAAPVPLLEQMSFLVVPLEGTAQDLEAAIGWTARRADMAIWCSATLDAGERADWQRLPDQMIDHAFLAVSGRSRPATREADSGIGLRFRAIHFLGSGPDQTLRLERFRSELLNHVEAARREDLEGALVFLDRFKPATATAVAPPAAHSPPEPPDFSDLLDPVPAQRSAHTAPGADIVSFLAAQSGQLARLCDQPGLEALADAAPAVLRLCAESIEACNEIAAATGGDLADLLAEASDLVLLMQVEETPQAMTDAVALMVQLRHECETLRCA